LIQASGPRKAQRSSRAPSLTACLAWTTYPLGGNYRSQANGAASAAYRREARRQATRSATLKSLGVKVETFRVLIGVVAWTLCSILEASPTSTAKCETRSYSVRDGLQVVCSGTWQFAGTCHGKDLWNEWKVTGRTSPPDAFIRPWLDYPITVIGYELVKLQPEVQAPGKAWWARVRDVFSAHRAPGSAALNASASFFMIGSTIQADTMIWLAPGQTHAKTIWPSGTGQPWPSAAEAAPAKPILDDQGAIYAAGGDILVLHGACSGGGPVTVFVTIYYTDAH
jgi:hypothetical protein